MIRYVQQKKIDYDRIQKYLDESVKVSRFSNGGPIKVALEKKLKEILKLPDSKAVVAVCNGTAAFHILVHLYDSLDRNSFADPRWTTIAYNFPSVCVNNLDTRVIDIENTQYGYAIPLKELRPNSKLVIPTLFGTLPDNYDELVNHCKKSNIILVLDNASSPINTKNNLFTSCDASFGSLHHTKYLGFGEGGFLVVDYDNYHKVDSIANFGFFQDRQYNKSSFNYKISDISAAFILAHIDNYSILDHQKVQHRLIDGLKVKGIHTFGHSEGVVYGNLPIKFSKPISHLKFRDYGIEANKYYKPLEDLPESQELFSKLVNFPLHSDLLDYEIDKLVEQIVFVSESLK